MKWSTALVFAIAIVGLIVLALAPVPYLAFGVRISTMVLIMALAIVALIAP